MAKCLLINTLFHTNYRLQLSLLLCFVTCIGLSESTKLSLSHHDNKWAEGFSTVNSRVKRSTGAGGDDSEPLPLTRVRESRLKRSSSDQSSGVDPNDRTTVFALSDKHSTLVVHWAGKGSDIIIALAKNSEADSTSLYFSVDYGKTFTKKDDKLKVDESTSAIIHQFYNSTDDYIFTDTVHSCLFITRNDGSSFERVCNLPFKPAKLSINPYNHRRLLGIDPDSHDKKLYISEDFGRTWEFLYDSVKDFYWGVYPHDGSNYRDTLYIHESLNRVKGQLIKVTIRKSNPPRFIPLAQDVIKATVDGSYIYVVKSVNMLGSRTGPALQLWVSYDRGELRNSLFPINYGKVNITEFYVVDMSEGQVMVCVSVNSSYTNLYISEVRGHKFTLSLEKIVFFNPESTNRQSWIRFYTNQTFADITRVAGVPGVYIASQQIGDTLDINTQRTLISFDKGGKWDAIEPPERVLSLHPDACSKQTNCSLHLTQEFSRIYPMAETTPILSQKSAPGLIVASGMLGETLKTDADVFVSSDAGLTWDQALSGDYIYAMGDHGGILVAVETETPTNEIMYSIDEGQTWHSYRFYKERINVYGLLTEPGEKSSVFSLFGSAITAHSWIIIQVDFMNAFENKNCTTEDYKWWSFGESQRDKNWCLLGRLTKYQKRVRNSICYNGRDFMRQKTVENCSCTVEDFECDFGFEESPFMKACVAIKDFDMKDLHKIPDQCPEGTFYPYSRGYRKVAGDTCQGGEDHRLGPLMYSCPIKEREDFLLVNMGRSVAMVNLGDGTARVIQLPHEESASLVVFNYEDNCIIYILEERSVKKLCFGEEEDDSAEMIRYVKASSPISCLAYDWTARNVYLCNETGSTIFVRNVDKPFERPLYKAKHGVHSPRSLVVDPAHGYMFFVDLIDAQKADFGVFRASMDGSNPKINLVANSSFVSSSSALTLELDTELLYWESRGRLVTSDYFGKNVSVLATSRTRLWSAVGIGLYKDDVYVAKTNGDTISMINKYMPGWWKDFPVHGGYVDDIRGLTVVSGVSQHAMSACSAFHKKCSQLCLPKPNPTSDPNQQQLNRTCLCGEGYRIRRLGNTLDEACSCEAGESMTDDGMCVLNANVTTCNSDQFICTSGQCIYSTWLCDGDQDCADGSDEVGCALKACGDGMFTCANGKCILATWKCDREDDCRDGKQTDELGCGTQNCTGNQFQCADGYCIHSTWRCDGDNDCHDFSDERDCHSSDGSCRDWEFQCRDGTCVSGGYHCNGLHDCPDSSDEDGCHGAGNNCSSSWEFACGGGGGCINTAWVCDGMDDCDDGSDESDCNATITTGSPVTRSPSTYSCSNKNTFHCSDSVCIPLGYVCNGINDCGHYEDEQACDDLFTTAPSSTTSTSRPSEQCQPFEYQCETSPNATAPSPTCLWRKWVCDGDEDCPLGDDERGCHKECPEPSFYCLFDGNCIPRYKVCDGHADCQDKTDEQQNCHQGSTHAPTGNYSCPADYFHCNDYRQSCVPFTTVCDGKKTCQWGMQDEEDCNECEGQGRMQISGSTYGGMKGCNPSDCPAYVWFNKFDKDRSTLNLNWRKNTNHAMIFAYKLMSSSGSNKTTPFTKKDMTSRIGMVELSPLLPNAVYSIDFLVKLDSGKLCPVGRTTQTTMAGIPYAPINVLVKVRGDQNDPYIVLLWKKPVKSNGRILSYMIFYQEMSDDLKHPVGKSVRLSIEDFFFASNKAPSGDADHDYQTALKGYFEWHKHYSIRMAARSTQGMSSVTEKTIFYMSDKDDGHHHVDMKVTAVPVNDTSARVSWKADPLALKYTVVGLSIGGQEQVTVPVNKSDTEVVVDDLCPGETFVFSVHVTHGAKAETVHAAKPVTLPGIQDRPPMVQNVVVVKTGPTSVMVNFTVPDSQHGLPNYIYYTTEGVSYQGKTILINPQRVALPANSPTQREVKGLDACVRYWLSVVPAHPTCQGYGVQTFVTLEDEKAPPQHVRAKILHDNPKSPIKLRLMWDASCYVISRPLNYVIRVRTGRGAFLSFSTPKATSDTKMLSFEIPAVTPGENYTLVVRASVEGARESPVVHVHIPEEFSAWHLRVDRVAETEKEVVLKWKWDNTMVPEFKTYNIKYSRVDLGGDDDSTSSTPMENQTKSSSIRLTLPHTGIYIFKVSALAYDGVEVSSKSLQYDMFSTHEAHGSGSGDDGSVSLSKTNLVAIIVPVSVVVVMLSAGIVFFMVRHRRLQRSFLAFANSHYNIQSGTTTFSDDLDDDEPMIQGFSDDEPLVIG